jgi:hypothetical protein
MLLMHFKEGYLNHYSSTSRSQIMVLWLKKVFFFFFFLACETLAVGLDMSVEYIMSVQNCQ